MKLDLALQHDPLVPQRDALLDVDEIGRFLARRVGVNKPVSLDACKRVATSYRIGKRVRVLYEIGVGDDRYLIAASTFRSASRSERAFHAAMEDPTATGPLRPVVHDAELDTVFWTFPNDRRIAALPDVARASVALTRRLGRPWTKSRVVDYTPEVSAVVRCLDGAENTVAYAKVHSGDVGERNHRTHRALVQAARGSALRVPLPLAYSRHHHTLMVEPVRGRAVGHLEGLDLLTGLAAYGGALATLHSLPLPEALPGTRPVLERVRRKAAGIGVVRPDVEALCDELLGELEARWEQATGPLVLVHGDANANNAIVEDGRVGLIDFERVALGSAGSDIGKVLSLFAYQRALGFITRVEEEERAAAFLRGYSSVRDVPARSLVRVHTSAALAERAFLAVSRLQPRPLRLVPTLLTEARELLK